MPQVKLAHITDLHLLDDKQLEQFICDLPGMVAALRIAARTSALVDEVVVRAGMQEVRASVQEMVQAEQLDAQGVQLAQTAVRRARQPGL